MATIDIQDSQGIEKRLRELALKDHIRLTLHGHQEMVAEEISYQAISDILIQCRVLENYPDHQRGPCCLVCGQCRSGRYLHIVCTTTLDVIVVITTYEPKPPKWQTAFKRGI